MEKRPVPFLNDPRIFKVTSCSNCPFSTWHQEEGKPFCLSQQKLTSTEVIPMWCPLPKLKGVR